MFNKFLRNGSLESKWKFSTYINLKTDLKNFIAEKKYIEVENLWFNAKKMHETELDGEIYTHMFRYFTRQRNHQQTIYTFEHAIKHGTQFRKSDLSELFHSFYVLGRLDDILKFTEAQDGKYEAKHFKKLIQVCRYDGNIRLALSFLKEMDNYNFQIDEYTIHSLLEVCKSAECHSILLKIFHKYEYIFDAKCYHSLLSILVHLECPAEFIERVLQHMMKKNIPPNDVSILLLADAYAREGNVEKILKLFSKKQDKEMFVHILKSLCKLKRFSDIENYLNYHHSFSRDPFVIKQLLMYLFDEQEYELMDNIFSKYGEKHFRYQFNGLYDWDVHGFNFATTVAILRHVLKFTKPGASYTLVTGSGVHKTRNKKTLKESILENSHLLGNIEVSVHPQNDGVLIIKNRKDDKKKINEKQKKI